MARPNSLHTDSQEAGPSRPTSIRSVTPSRKGKERASDVDSGSDDGDSDTDTDDHDADKQTGLGASKAVSSGGASGKARDRASATHAGSSDGTDTEEDSEDEDDPDDVTGVIGGVGGLTQTSSNSASPPTLESHTNVSDSHQPAADAEEDSDDDVDEEEPVLKYSRVKGKIPEILAKDSASAVAVSARVLAIGTHVGMVHILSYEGAKVNSYRPHAASVTSLRMDEENDFVATASVEGRVVIHSITSTESYAFDYKRPMHCVALEPGFGKKTTRAFVCGGMAGNLIMQEKGWLGYKEQILHSGEGPIWAVEWRGNLIAWANDQGVKIYDTVSQQRIGYIDRGAHAPRAELFKCTLHWKDDSTLLIAWADYIKVIRIRTRSRPASSVGVNMSMPVSVGAAPSLFIEMTAIYQVDCMISGLVPFGSAYLILAYIPPDTYDNEATSSREEQRRKAANRPELRIIDKGEETSADALGISQFHTFGCNDYLLAPSKRGEEYFVVSPKDVVVVRKRDEADHVDWLVERERFEEALQAAEEMSRTHGGAVDVAAIGRKYMQHLVGLGDYTQAAALAPKVLAKDVQQWEEWINLFQQRGRLQTIIPVVPTKAPQLSKTTYETILNYFLLNDKPQLLSTINTWPTEIYDLRSITDEVRSELEAVRTDTVLLEVMGELLVLNRQPEKALPYFLQIRKPNVFDLIRDYNLFTAIQSQALQLVDFDQERVRPQEADEERNAPSVAGKHGRAIELLVEHTHSIPIDKVVHQLESKPKYLYMYLDALFDRDQQVVLPYSDRMVELYALFDHDKLMPFLRSSNFYDLEKALKICKSRDYVTEQVFLLGRMGNNKQALMLIIERLGDVERAIDFAKEQRDEDLWEDLLSYSETRPLFIRALLEHVGSEINPIRLISRIKDGLEVPGLKQAVVKILQSSNLQAGLLQGCQSILEGDVDAFMRLLERGQTACLRGSPATICPICDLPAYVQTDTSGDDDLTGPQPTLAYLCRHTVHARCALPHADVALPPRPESAAVNQLLSQEGRHGTKGFKRSLATRLGYAAALKVRVGSCPVCKRAKAGQSKVDSDATWGSGSKLIRTRA